MYHHLVEEKEFKSEESTVRLAVQQLKDEIPKTFVPFEFNPGEAVQVDWGETTVYESCGKGRFWNSCKTQACY
ncbi:hypothetical protein Q2T46_09255 [Thermoanaerobacterium sp. CMT5567-10]|uniref:hypothetical protein n=1 Tax=Thermoanaerobacterium sp. CMT5567-10 TaxID=3061989 RepID=UPI0026E0564E|nr:hypothetical protein [Thermoanaerobacterium sp. CMT5567-10]WKV07754.1 hypothetical protein Q2T46_09255 [Thermoanaerobacterium sp. CMT5567-10]